MAAHKRVVLFPYSMTSGGCKQVAANLTTMEVPNIRVYSDRDYEPKKTDFIVGWGAGHSPGWLSAAKSEGAKYINTPAQISRSVNKIDSFSAFRQHGVNTPPWTLSEAEAVSWSKDGKWVCCRQSVEGMDGSGLILAKKPREMVYASLFTQFVPNQSEYRVYVFDGKVIDTLSKHPDDDATNMHIRTESNHYIYARENNLSKKAHTQAIKATEALGLTFSGVDMVLGDDGEFYVLETNTAPGIGQITARKIAEAIRDMAGL